MRQLPLLMVLAAACSGGSPCEDEDGNELPSCIDNAHGVELEYCPGDEWGAADGCNSCGCDGDGNILCTSVPVPCTPGG
jgi:hypothetical protein